jgi:hypothetical protein
MDAVDIGLGTVSIPLAAGRSGDSPWNEIGTSTWFGGGTEIVGLIHFFVAFLCPFFTPM